MAIGAVAPLWLCMAAPNMTGCTSACLRRPERWEEPDAPNLRESGEVQIGVTDVMAESGQVRRFRVATANQ